MYGSELSFNSSRDNSSHDRNEYVKVPIIEVLCREEDICCDKAFDFSDLANDGFFVVSSSSHLDNDQSQEKKTCDEVLFDS